jgi:ribonuclease BN (tRNA processing enzyme)
LDGGRFRLPLVSAVRRLAAKIDSGMLLVDAPGVVRSVAGAELLVEFVEAAAIDIVLVLCREKKRLPMADELATLTCDVVPIEASPAARPPGKRRRARQRTRLWDAYLIHAVEKSITVADINLTGTPPPPESEEHWPGRQVALLQKGKMIGMGEIVRVEKDTFHARIAGSKGSFDQILCRDACRNREGLLVTEKRGGAVFRHTNLPPDIAPYPAAGKRSDFQPVVSRFTDATAILLNGIFGDPLLHLRLHNRKRSILFDLGEGSRLPARLAHQVTDVFISHAHFDHISGFLWLLRSRIGNLPPCRLFGPPGMADHIAGLISGIHWDRIGDWGPKFTVSEFHDGCLNVYTLQAGKDGKTQLEDQPAPAGLLLTDRDCMVRAEMLHHGSIPVLAYCLEFATKLNVRKERLAERSLAPGPWLGELKKGVTAGDGKAMIGLPDGSTAAAENLAAELLKVTPGQRLVYATDIADTAANRDKLTVLAGDGHCFFCEASFLEADKRYADLSGHLTTRACGEIARTAGVEYLAPFHFSRRYEKNSNQIYDEVSSFFCGRIARPTVISP